MICSNPEEQYVTVAELNKQQRIIEDRIDYSFANCSAHIDAQFKVVMQRLDAIESEKEYARNNLLTVDNREEYDRERQVKRAVQDMNKSLPSLYNKDFQTLKGIRL